MKNNLDTPVAKQCRALYTKYRTRTYVRPIKSGPQGAVSYFLPLLKELQVSLGLKTTQQSRYTRNLSDS